MDARQRLLARGRRGRPTQNELEEINAAVIGTARAMFLNEGYDTASMEEIARRAGVSKKTLYARFSSKAELFAAVVAAQVAVWSAKASRYEHALGATLGERLEHHAVIFLETNSEPEAQAFERMLLTQARRFPELGRIYYETAVEVALELIIKEIESAAKRDGVAVRDAREAALTFTESMLGWSTLKMALGLKSTAAERRRAARYRAAVFMEGRAAW